MKKSLLFLILSFISLLAFSQTTVKTEFKTKLSGSQNHGITKTTGDFLLTVTYDENTIQFNTNVGETMTAYTVTKQTDKYVIGKDAEENYAFYDIQKKQLSCINYFISRFTTAGYGPDDSEAKQTVLGMMDLLREGETREEVIQLLVSQAEAEDEVRLE